MSWSWADLLKLLLGAIAAYAGGHIGGSNGASGSSGPQAK